jgi:hypothetical protein
MKITRYSVVEYERHASANKCFHINLFCCKIDFLKNATYYFECVCYTK